jgi:WD40 repeat protein
MRLGTQRWRDRNGFDDPVFSPDGRWVLSTSGSGLLYEARELTIWEWSTGRVVRRLKPTAFPEFWPFNYCTFLPDGKRVISHGHDELLLWHFPSFRLLERRRVGHWASLIVSRDGQLAAGVAEAAMDRLRVHVCNLRTGKLRAIRETDARYIEGIALTGDGCLVVVQPTTKRQPGVLDDRTFIVLRIDLLTHRVCGRFTLQARDIVLAPDGRHLVASSGHGDVRLYRVDTGTMRRLPLTAGPRMYYNMMFRCDGQVLVRVGHPLPRYRSDGSEEPVDRGPLLAWIWDVERGELLDRVRIPDRWPNGSPNWPMLSPDGRALLFSSRDAVTRVSLRTGKPLDDRPAINEPILGLRWSAGGRELMVETWSESQVKWNAATGRLLAREQRRDYGILQSYTPRAQAPDGRWLAMGSGSSIELFDVQANKMKHKLDGHEQDLRDLQYSADGRLLASVDEGGGVRLWDARRGRPMRVLDAPKKMKKLEKAIFSPDGRHLAATDQKGPVHIWEVRTGKYIQGLALPKQTLTLSWWKTRSRARSFPPRTCFSLLTKADSLPGTCRADEKIGDSSKSGNSQSG